MHNSSRAPNSTSLSTSLLNVLRKPWPVKLSYVHFSDTNIGYIWCIPRNSKCSNIDCYSIHLKVSIMRLVYTTSFQIYINVLADVIYIMRRIFWLHYNQRKYQAPVKNIIYGRLLLMLHTKHALGCKRSFNHMLKMCIILGLVV